MKMDFLLLCSEYLMAFFYLETLIPLQKLFSNFTLLLRKGSCLFEDMTAVSLSSMFIHLSRVFLSVP